MALLSSQNARLERLESEFQMLQRNLERYDSHCSTILTHKNQPTESDPTATLARLDSFAAEIAALKQSTSSSAPPPLSIGDLCWESRTSRTIPFFFGRFHAQHFTLLYRGSRDGFRSHDFHCRCDGRAPTITLIRTIHDSVFGGYAAVAWDSSDSMRADATGTSFLFTLSSRGVRNEKHFPIQQGRLESAIGAYRYDGPVFGEGRHDICVLDNCNTTGSNHTAGGTVYGRDKPEAKETAQTDFEPMFTVAEIEVWQAG
jgi:hypothetical protein